MTTDNVNSLGRKMGFFLGLAGFFTILNILSYHFSQSPKRGLLMSIAAALILAITFLINRRYKKWVW